MKLYLKNIEPKEIIKRLKNKEVISFEGNPCKKIRMIEGVLCYEDYEQKTFCISCNLWKTKDTYFNIPNFEETHVIGDIRKDQNDEIYVVSNYNKSEQTYTIIFQDGYSYTFCTLSDITEDKLIASYETWEEAVNSKEWKGEKHNNDR